MTVVAGIAAARSIAADKLILFDGSLIEGCL